MIHFARIAIGVGGVVRCRLCAPPAEERPHAGADVEQRIARVASGFSTGPGPNVILGGFEPFKHPELPQLIGAAVRAGCSRVRVVTDARALGVGGNAAGAYAAGVRGIEVVALGAEAGTHDRLVGAPGAHAALCTGVVAYRAAGDAVSITGVVRMCRHNAEDAAGTAALFASLGASAVRLDVRALKRTQANEAIVAGALQTATVNRVAGYVSGWEPYAPALYARAPWYVEEVAG